MITQVSSITSLYPFSVLFCFCLGFFFFLEHSLLNLPQYLNQLNLSCSEIFQSSILYPILMQYLHFEIKYLSIRECLCNPIILALSFLVKYTLYESCRERVTSEQITVKNTTFTFLQNIYFLNLEFHNIGFFYFL